MDVNKWYSGHNFGHWMIFGTHLMQPKYQPPKILHRIVLVKIIIHPFVRRRDLVMDPTLWCSLVFALDSQKRYHQRPSSMHIQMVPGTIPNQMCKLLLLYHLCSHHRPMLLKRSENEARKQSLLFCFLMFSVCNFVLHLEFFSKWNSWIHIIMKIVHCGTKGHKKVYILLLNWRRNHYELFFYITDSYIIL